MSEDNGGSVDTGSSSTEKTRKSNGIVGVASTSLQLKQRWALEGKGMSLKAFARKLLKAGDELVSDWFAHKEGVLNQDRTAANRQKADEANRASKAAKRK